MTKKIYYEDQYLRSCTAKVLEIDNNKIKLDQTIFIPQSNTEPGDLGKINGYKIAGSKKEDDDIWHIIPKEFDFQVGDEVKLEIDWKNRINMMRFHSALHLLAGPFEKILNIRAVAGAVKKNQCYLAFKEEITKSDIDKIIIQANQDIETNLEIKSYPDKKREGFRWTQVGDYSAIPDGGLHVKHTEEIGKIEFIEEIFEKGSWKVVCKIS